MYDASIGFVAIPDVLSPSGVSDVLSDCHALIASPVDELRPGDKPVSGTHHLVALENRLESIANLVRPSRGESALLDTISTILTEDHRLDDASYRSPQPGFGGQRLHADDVPKLDDGPDRVATAIVALTDFTKSNGATRVVPRSHRRVDQQRLSGSLEHHDEELTLTGSAGTAFVFTGHLLHSGTTNRSTAERPALQLVWRTPKI